MAMRSRSRSRPCRARRRGGGAAAASGWRGFAMGPRSLERAPGCRKPGHGFVDPPPGGCYNPGPLPRRGRARAVDYKATIQLPRTEFPMKANLPQREPEILKEWEEQAIFRRLVARNAERPGASRFVL